MRDAAAVEIREGSLSALIRPEMGGGIARFDHIGAGGVVPLFRPEPTGGAGTPFDLAAIVLLPWSNRVSGGGFRFAGRWHELAPNLAGEPFAIHGNGFALPWRVERRAPAALRLSCRSDGPGPYAYMASLRYAIAGGALRVALSVTNRAEIALPFGLGLHPWLPRSLDLRIEAPAAAVWEEDDRHLPKPGGPVPIPADWRFDRAAPLPAGFVNNAFAGWRGAARLSWPSRGLALDIRASRTFPLYILYAPGPAADFFCFEPVSHPVDAVNLPGGPAANGMAILAPGETLAGTLRFACRAAAG